MLLGMSWDVWIVNVPEGLQSFDELPADYELAPIGRATIIDVSRRHLGHVEPRGWSETHGAFVAVSDNDAVFLAIDGPDVFGELGLPNASDGGTGSVTLNIRGGSDMLIPTILRWAQELGARAFDMQSGDWLRSDDGATSFEEWNRYRASLLGDIDSQ